MLTLRGEIWSAQLVIANAAHAFGVIFSVCVLAFVYCEFNQLSISSTLSVNDFLVLSFIRYVWLNMLVVFEFIRLHITEYIMVIQNLRMLLFDLTIFHKVELN